MTEEHTYITFVIKLIVVTDESTVSVNVDLTCVIM